MSGHDDPDIPVQEMKEGLLQMGREIEKAMAKPKTRTLLFAVVFPDNFDPEETDPDMVADELVTMVNEERRRNEREGWFQGDVAVSGIPAAQWMTVHTMRNLRENADLRRAVRWLYAEVMCGCGCSPPDEVRAVIDRALGENAK